MEDPAAPEENYHDAFYECFIYEASDDMQFTDNTMAFTWSPNPGRYPSTTPSIQYKSLLQILFKFTKIFGTFIFTPELTVNGNIHIHGMYTVKDRVRYFKSFLPILKSYGFLLIKPIDNRDKWIEYICKDVTEMNNILEDHLPIPLTHYNVGTYKHLFQLLNKTKKIRLRMSNKNYASLHKKKLTDYFK